MFELFASCCSQAFVHCSLERPKCLRAFPKLFRPLDGPEIFVGNSVFLDANLNPHSDQWAYLPSIRKIERSTVEEMVSRAERRGRVVGVRLPVSDDHDMKKGRSPCTMDELSPTQVTL